MLKTLYKKADRKTLVICGHLTQAEIKELKREGWRLREPQVNKNGIPVRG